MDGGGFFCNEDRALAFQQGDEDALAFFFHAFHPALTHFSYRWVKAVPLAEEIAAGAFVKAWGMRRKLCTCAGIRAYLYRIVQRDSQLALRREQRRAQAYSSLHPSSDSADAVFQHLVRSETYRLVHAAIQQLAPGYRKVIMMHFIDGKSTGEIARELKAPLNTIKAQKLKGLKALRKAFLRPLLLLF